MAVLNSTQKRKARELCRERDGDKCSIGIRCNNITGDEYRKQSGHDFDLHHLDRNRENNPVDGSNHALACHPCNCAQDPRGKTTRPKFSKFRNLKNRVSKNEGERVWDGEREWRWSDEKAKPATMKKNEQAEPLFKMGVIKMVREQGGISKRKDLLDAGAEIAGCSQATAARYLDKMCSYFGKFQYVGYEPERKTHFPINNISNYDGEIYVMTKADLEEIRPTQPQEPTA